MKKSFNRFFMVLLASVLCLSAAAQTTDEPTITIKTNAYANDGALNVFTLMIGANTADQYIDVDCGFGKVEYELKESLFDTENQALDGTAIPCTVSKDGIVKIYCDNPGAIDYINADGCAITEIDLSQLPNLGVLSMNHNELKSLDLTPNSNLKAIYLSDNEFTEATPLIIGANKPNLTILEVSIIKYMDPSFNLSDYPNMMSFDGYHNDAIHSIDPTGCPKLLRLSLDLTHIQSIDVSQNPELLILNVSDTGVRELDLSNNTKLQQLYCSHDSGSYYTDVKISQLDLSHNPALIYLFCASNNLTELDLSGCPDITHLYANNNYISKIDLTGCAALWTVKIQQNCLDFATLPFDPGTWDEFEYDQRPMPVAKSYPVGAKIDLSNRVIREDSPTYCALYTVSNDSPGSYVALDNSYYTYENGIITLNEVYADSLLLGFTNDEFPNMALYTTKFMVKSEADYGKPSKLLSFSPAAYSGSISFSVGVAGASAESPKEILVDFGDGVQVPYTITTSEAPAEPNVAGTRSGYGALTVYGADGIDLTAFASDGIEMYSFDCSSSISLNYLKVANAGLYNVNLEYNRCLKYLDLSGNNLSSFTLTGHNEYYNKNFLTDLVLSNNAISSFEFTTLAMLHRIDLSNNKIEALDFSDADFIESINVANNLFSEINVLHCTALKSLDFSGNRVTSWIEPEENNIEWLNLSRNNFTLGTLPARSALLTEENYYYAPQNEMLVATKGPCADLSAQVRELDGMSTIFVWRDAEGNALTEGTDYSISNGYTRFLDPIVGKTLRCEMSHPSFPDFTGDDVYRTTAIEAAGMPDNLLATFKTANVGDEVNLSLAANKENTAVYIDWSGDGNLTQYLLGTTYRLFTTTTMGAKTVNVYTYSPEETITVFSMKGATLSSFDGSSLTDAICINVSNAGLFDITLPKSGNLRELTLDGNSFTSFDPSEFPQLYLLSLNSNKLRSLDLSTVPGLGLVSAADNNISSVTLDGNDALWQLYLGSNALTEINLDGAPNLAQVSLADNYLTHLNVDNLNKLIALSIDHNYFRFSTLPPVKSQYGLYQYFGQYPIDVTPVDGKVDISSEAVINGNATDYAWYLDMPYVNEEGELEGEILYEGTEYTIENGVTTFLKKFNNVMCVMTNTEFPDLLLTTNLFDITELGVDGIAVNGGIKVAVEGNTINVTAESGEKVALVAMNGIIMRTSVTAEGGTTLNDVPAGSYVLAVGSKSFKVVVR